MARLHFQLGRAQALAGLPAAEASLNRPYDLGYAQAGPYLGPLLIAKGDKDRGEDILATGRKAGIKTAFAPAAALPATVSEKAKPTLAMPSSYIPIMTVSAAKRKYRAKAGGGWGLAKTAELNGYPGPAQSCWT